MAACVPFVSGPLYWETRAMCAAIELGETTEPRMRAYLLTVAANARLEVLAWRRVDRHIVTVRAARERGLVR